MANKIVRETIHAKGIDIGIYTNDFENEYISLTDIALYKSDDPPAFTMSPKKWIETTNAIGIVSKAGRYGGTYAHSEWIKSLIRCW